MATVTTTQAKTRFPTVAEWMARYDEQPVEVVDGEFVIISPPTEPHAHLSNELYFKIRTYLEQHPLGRAYADSVPYILDGDPRTDWVRNSRVPDVSFVSQERLAAHRARFGDAEGPLRLAPDLAVEVISQGDSFSDVMEKVRDYLRFGVRLVWLVDRHKHVVYVYTPDDPAGHVLTGDDTLTGEDVLPGWQLPVRDLFAGPEA
ncbi:MAG: Uma2 family endonuclease [Anaerolineae bacterium]|nr:Uma2 family endonuclease [Anaerolineae bacterium]